MTTIFFLVYLAHLFSSIGACPLGCECDVSLIVTCTKLNLTDVPDDIPTDTKELYLDVNFITILKNDSFSNLHGLTLLAIRFNQIHTIESGAFNNLTKLSHLYLDNNYISQLSEDVFFPLLVINTVSLEYNNISTLWKFSSVSPLATLNLRYNKISFIESCTFVGLTNLKVLQLDRNNVSTIEDRALEGLAHLQNLYLQHNALISLPDSLFSCCTVIQLLDFSHNKIEELPDLTFLWNLTLLDSSHNDILYIDENAFTAQSRLQTLELQNNLLNSVPVLHSVVSLTTLDLERNRISYVPDDAFHNKSNFRDLRLGYNLMKRIPEAVKGLTLQTLRLNGNPIVRVEANAFEGLNNLHRLQLDRMALIHLDENAFLDLKQNQEPLSLFLNDNQLQSLPGEIFSDLNIDIINLEDNLWSCDCAMCEYSHWLSNHNEIEKFDVTCVQPDQYLDIMLSEIHDTDDLICELPVIVESSNYIEAVEGDSVMFPCNATGLPLPFIYWQTPHGHKISLETDMDDIMLLSNGTLILHNAAFSDCGIYSCVAINEAGEDVFNTTLLVVFDTINTTQQQTVPVTSQGTSNA
ncbi:carboxypeptidase N subunit 2-like [Ptychodera flava]|uniref:carboxypeptidase N subunit 2-like n=1 Tax=Ptychodera flava TaxID=63121 RepID=UPI00396A6884